MSDDWGKEDVTPSRQLARRIMRPLEDRYGVIAGWRTHRASQRSWENQRLSSEVFDAAAQRVPEGPAPVFVLAATWRSGSTLLQRLLLSSGDIMMWGEPWNRCDLVPLLRESLRPVHGEWPVHGHVVDELEADEPLHQLMVPDLYPTRSDLIDAHRALFLRLYAEPAFERGYARWGFKETRLGALDARYLHALFPEARIVFLYRDPYASWSSYVALRGMGYERWPDEPIVSPKAFGDMWRTRVAGFQNYPAELPHLSVSFESLLSDPSVIDELGAFCGVTPDRSTLDTKVGRSHGARLPNASVARIEQAVGAVAVELGYDRP